ncbi:MAG: hypothetical protein RL653_4236 [Pseudomonadota bacterium]|jgi:hypothetical protein
MKPSAPLCAIDDMALLLGSQQWGRKHLGLCTSSVHVVEAAP